MQPFRQRFNLLGRPRAQAGHLESPLVAGQGGSDDAIFGRGQRDKADVPTSVIGKVDPKTMTYKQLISVPTSDVISPATVAIQVGNEYWTGAFRGDRLVIYPVGFTAAGR